MSSERVCEQCGAQIKAAMLRCMECGARSTITPAPSSRPATSAAPAANASNGASASGGVQIVGRSTPPRTLYSRATERRSPGNNGTDSTSSRKVAASVPSQAQASPPAAESARVSGNEPDVDLSSDSSVREKPGSTSSAGGEPFVVKCNCGARIRVPAHRAGSRKRCKKCNAVLTLEPPARKTKPPVPEVKPQSDDEPDLRIRLESEIDQAVERLREVEDEQSLSKSLSSRKLAKLEAGLEVENPLSKSEALQRRKIILELGESRDRRVLDVIAPLASESFEAVRQAVVTAASEIGGAQGIEIALRMLLDRDGDVVRDSLKALRKLKSPCSVRPLLIVGLDNPLLKLQATETIVQMGDVAVEALLEIVETQTQGMVFDAIVILGRIGSEEAIPALLDTLNNPSGPIRGYAVEALSRIGNTDVLPNIVRLLDDDDHFVRLHAAMALRNMPDKRSVRPLLGCLLEATDPELIRHCVFALGAAKDPRAVPAIARLAEGADDSLREAIAESLGMISDPAACESLLVLLRTGSTELQLKVLVALKKSATTEALDDLIGLTNHPNAKIRRHTVEALTELAPPEAEDVFGELLLSDAVYDVRVAAAKGLGQLGIPSVAATLEKALRDEAPVRCAAVMALSRLDDKKIVPVLIASLRDPAPEVRYHAVTGLGRMNADSAAKPVTAMLEDPDAMVRKGAEKALDDLGIEKPRVTLGRRAAGVAGKLIPSSLLGSIPASAAASVAAVLLVVVGGGSWFLLKDAIGGPPAHLVLAQTPTVSAVTFVPETQQIVVRRGRNSYETWDGATGEFVKKPPAEEAGKYFKTAPKVPAGLSFKGTPAVSPDGRFAVGFAPSPDPRVWTYVLYDAKSGEAIAEYKKEGLQAYQEFVFNDDATLLIASSEAQLLMFKDPGKGLVEPETVKVELKSPAFTDENTLIGFGRGLVVARYNIMGGKYEQWSVRAEDADLNLLAASDNGQFLVASGEKEKHVWIVNTQDGSGKDLDPMDIPR